MEYKSGYCQKRRCIDLEMGREYIVQPMNALKLKHRGRRCFISTLNFDHGGGIWVRFVDKESRGKVSPSDLIPTDGKYREYDIQ